jgi:hypothetical protein
VQARVVSLLKNTLKKLLAPRPDASDPYMASPNALQGLVLLRCARTEVMDDEEEAEAEKKKGGGAAPVKSSTADLIPELAALSYFDVKRGDYTASHLDSPIDTIWRITDSDSATLSAPHQMDKMQRYHSTHLG